ncbi:MAG TPA: hypothetical protein VFQ32_11215, partial [Ktedonobacterales bacterium]|nr:hypothetical protein [Ktedonobacterales bacterium]
MQQWGSPQGQGNDYGPNAQYRPDQQQYGQQYGPPQSQPYGPPQGQHYGQPYGQPGPGPQPAAPVAPPLLLAQDVVKQYKVGDGVVTALRRVTLAVGEGRIIAI